MTFSRIIGTGSFLPEKIMTNADLEKIIDTTDEWIQARTGIQQRHIAVENQFTSDLAEQAARRAIKAAGIAVTDIDLIIVATTTPDQVFPSTACLLQEKLGIKRIPAFDIQAVCSGFIFALDMADKYIRCGQAKHVLIVGAETMSRILDWSDRRTCVLFGDGAGAAVLKADNEAGLITSHIHSDGRYKDLLCVPSGVSKNYQDVQSGEAYLTMEGGEVFRWAVTELGDIVTSTLKDAGISVDELDWLVPHQANIRIINAVGKRAGIDPSKVVITVQKHGNTSAASVPLALDLAVRDGRIQTGQNVLLEAFGGGFTWGSALLKM